MSEEGVWGRWFAELEKQLEEHASRPEGGIVHISWMELRAVCHQPHEISARISKGAREIASRYPAVTVDIHFGYYSGDVSFYIRRARK